MPHYSRAPITEAVIDVRITPGAPLDGLSVVGEGEEERYPLRKELLQVHGQIDIGPHPNTSAGQRPCGNLFISRDERQACQFRTDGFAFSRLAPYETWEALRDEAGRLWNRYRSRLGAFDITRVGLRYINRIDIPFPQVELKDYFNTTPEVAPQLHYNALSAYYMQLQIPQPDLDATLIIRETFSEPSTTGVVSVILDIDLFVEASIGEEELWPRLESLRVRKNEVFEASITDHTRELIV
ncbi:MAG: TIGR04255 family protein [Chloroflexi bacterium]|nr:TIGR04255 family protein [Chloroflexota bacterium]